MLRGPMNRSGKLHALLSTARVANIPSVISNVWLGLAVGMLTTGTPPDAAGSALILLPLAGVLLYVSGNFFNDWMDRSWDVSHRPERALPRGLFPPGLYAAAALLLGTAGVMLAWLTDIACGRAALGIVFCIVIYTHFHKRTPWAVIPMGLCRALLPVLGCFAFFPYIDRIWPAAFGLLAYIMGLSLIARHEAMAGPPKWVNAAGRGLLLGTALLMAWGAREVFRDPLLAVIGAVPYLVWTSLSLRIWRKPVPLLVSRLLAGIPLVDGMILLPTGILLASSGTEISSGLMIPCLIVPPLAFIGALLLQKLAPAT